MYKIDRRGGSPGGGSKNRSLGIYLDSFKLNNTTAWTKNVNFNQYKVEELDFDDSRIHFRTYLCLKPITALQFMLRFETHFGFETIT